MPSVEFRLPDPNDERYTWFHDTNHFATALPPLIADLASRFFQLGTGMEARLVNGFFFVEMSGKLAGQGIPIPLSPFDDPLQTWEEHCKPITIAACEAVQSVDYEAMTAVELVTAMDRVIYSAALGFSSTMHAIQPAAGRLMPLVMFLSRHFPADAMLRAMTLVGGHENDTAGLGGDVQRVARTARENAAIAAALSGGDFDEALRLAPGTAFGSAFDAFLAEHGASTQTWFNIHEPTWEEEPTALLRLIAGQVNADSDGHAVAGERRDAMLAECLAALESEQDRAALGSLVEAASGYVPVVEGRARWQVRCAGVVRPPLLSLGRKLAGLGAIEAADDVFFLRMSELAEAATGTRFTSAVSDRKTEYAVHSALTPPLSIGAPMSPEQIARNPMLVALWGYGVATRGTAGEVVGQAASRGIVTGRARVAHTLAEAELLEEGEILVCTFTSPPWTPLFAIAAAVVTNAGGVLSHAAIEAREYGIPCVAGTQNATDVIPDGAMIEVDGGTGVVRILEG